MPDSPAELFDRHHLAVYRYLLRMTARRDVAEDLTQDVFLRVVRGQDRYDERGQQRAWLLSIARNLLLDRHRRAQREPTTVVEEVADRAAGPDVGIDLRQALDRLPESDREVFVLRVVAGLGHEDIARVTGATAASVRCRIHRARAALKGML